MAATTLSVRLLRSASVRVSAIAFAIHLGTLRAIEVGTTCVIQSLCWFQDLLRFPEGSRRYS
jgi:hypothetical protein